MSISHTPENSSRSINEFSRTINKLFLRSGEETTVPIDYVPLLSTTKRYVARQSHVCLELWILDYHVMNFHLAVSKVLLTLLFEITSAPTTSLGRISDYLGEICIQLFKVQITRISWESATFFSFSEFLRLEFHIKIFSCYIILENDELGTLISRIVAHATLPQPKGFGVREISECACFVQSSFRTPHWQLISIHQKKRYYFGNVIYTAQSHLKLMFPSPIMASHKRYLAWPDQKWARLSWSAENLHQLWAVTPCYKNTYPGSISMGSESSSCRILHRNEDSHTYIQFILWVKIKFLSCSIKSLSIRERRIDDSYSAW